MKIQSVPRLKSIRTKFLKKKKLQERTEKREDMLNVKKMESHYCRSSSQKLYLEPQWQSKQKLYELYSKDWCNYVEPFSIAYFSNYHEDMNLSLFKRNKDECHVCVAKRVGNATEAEYELHTLKKKKPHKRNQMTKLVPIIKHLFQKLDNKTLGARDFGETIENQIEQCENMKVVRSEVDQKYLFQIYVAVSIEEYSVDLINRSPGKLSHSQWLILANRILLLDTHCSLEEIEHVPESDDDSFDDSDYAPSDISGGAEYHVAVDFEATDNEMLQNKNKKTTREDRIRKRMRNNKSWKKHKRRELKENGKEYVLI
ncbi:unnamed protein product [Diabrotica balteata]|uniref:Uncharacterized protein n=1 Tax=Diabrotica balteata TaxID=107213 RepID=A0A9N9X6M2_DIABA|nr:unnamed protein product [Diabrotica balteata]